MKFSYDEFMKKVNEHALYYDDLSRFDNYLNNIKNEKILLKSLTFEMSKFIKVLSELNWQSIFKIKFKRDEQYLLYTVKYSDRMENVINKISDVLESIEDRKLKQKANRIVYGDNEEMDFHIGIEIDTKDFNRIHITDDLPYSLRNLGLGKKLYKNIIRKIGFISSHSTDSTRDSKLVWDSLSEDLELYTCIKDQSIICFDFNLDKNIIENVLHKWVKNSTNYVIDSDLLKRYPDFDIS